MSAREQEKPLGLWHVVAIGIGAMVGAGIFALLGQAALLMRDSTWLAFAFGGIIAMFSGYAYARLGARYPSSGGIIDFFQQGLGGGSADVGAVVAVPGDLSADHCHGGACVWRLCRRSVA